MNSKPLRLLIATKNQGKVTELKNLLADLPVELKSLNDFRDLPEVEETGATFAENAALKARAYARHTNLWALADDSGLAVAALGSAPGVFSARFAGANADDKANISKLLQEIGEIPESNRAAQFICAMALADETGEIKFTAEGSCDGRITAQPHGTNGFGYDPVFVPEDFDKTFAEISAEAKQKISHRGRAAAKIIRYLRDFIAV